MNGRALVVAGLVGGGAAAGLTLFFMAVLHREPPELVVGFVAVALGMAAGHLVRRRTAEPEPEPEPARQLVGSRCPACDERIKIARDAVECEDCGATLHEACFDDHACR